MNRPSLHELGHRPEVLIEQIHCDLAVCQCRLEPIPDDLQHLIGCIHGPAN